MFKINEPCHEDWNTMTDAERGRHCAVCDKQVVDFTAMAESEALSLLNKAKSDASSCDTGICGRVHADPQGHLRFKQAKRRLLTDGMAAILAISVLAGCQGDGPVLEHSAPQASVESAEKPDPVKVKAQPPEQVIMGEMIAVPIEERPVAHPQPSVLMGDVVHVEAPVKAAPREMLGKIAIEPAADKPIEQAIVKGRIHVEP